MFHNRLFFQGTDGHAYFTDIDIETGSYGAPVDMYTSTETLALAPADWEVVYACYLQSDHIKRIVRISGGSSELWSGAIYATNLDLSFDVGRSDEIDYILTSEDEGKRILYLTYANGVWSDTKYVFPLDVLDDTSYYKMCSVSDLDGKFILTSKVRRSNGPIMLTYSFGPEMYTAGREMFIRRGHRRLPGRWKDPLDRRADRLSRSWDYLLLRCHYRLRDRRGGKEARSHRTLQAQGVSRR